MSVSSSKTRPLLREANLAAKLGRKAYEDKLGRLRRQLAQIQQAYLLRGHSAVIVFEGWDAAGKGGTIRRISSALDPRGFKVWPISAPRRYYLERHFLARFVERLPPNGAISVFDRSWYGRVLVERVEKLIPERRWKAAYDEINNFEKMLVDDGTRVIKPFFHISPEEQLRRFEARLLDPLKRWKLSYEDFRNRGKWPEYEVAIDQMFARTSTRHAPWTVIPANDKKFARIAAITEITRRLARGIDLSPPSLDASMIAEAKQALNIDETTIECLVASTRGRTD